MPIKRIADTLYTLRFLRLLVMDWKKMKAFDLGLIDEKGRKLRKAKTSEEKNQYTLFHRLVYNLKRLLERLPGNLTRKIASYASALYLIKEHTGLSEEEILLELNNLDLFVEGEENNVLSESDKYPDNHPLEEGDIHQLSVDVPILNNFDIDAKKGSLIKIEEKVGFHFGDVIYKATHLLTNESIFIGRHDVETKIIDEDFSVSTGDIAMPDIPIPKPLKTRLGDKYQRFSVPSNVFNNFDKGRKKYQRWKKYLDPNDEKQYIISQFAKKYRDATVIIQDENTGAMRAIRPTSSDGR